MNLVFVVPKFINKANDYYEIPLGILYIATVLKKEKYNVNILNLNSYFEEEEKKVLENYIKNNKVDIILTGGLSAFFHSINRIVQSVKEIDKTILTILGGGIVTSDKELISNEINPDFVVIGEGEDTIVELMYAIKNKTDHKKICGIGYKQDDKWIFTEDRKSINDIDSLPFPDFGLIDLDDYFKRQTPTSQNYLYPLDFPRALPIITSRSCPLNCTFCFHPIGQKYRKKDLDKVFLEIEHMIEKYKINILVIMDEMMSANTKRLVEFSKRIKKYNLLWTCQLWTSSVDEDTLKIMKDSGCYLISYGLESINEKVLLSMKKFGINKKNIEYALEATKKAEITIQGNFIFGDPEETYETSEETLNWWKQYPEYQISLGRVSPYPGTPLYKSAIEKNLISDRIDFIKKGTPSINMSKMSSKEYNELISKISTYSANARQYCEIISVERDIRTTYESYTCEIKCPHCKNTMTYGNIFIDKPEIIKLGCRKCSLRFDLNPAKFPNLQNRFLNQKNKLLALTEKYKSSVISPSVFENKFIEYFNLIDLDYTELEIKYVLDSKDSQVGELYLNKYTILKRDEQFLEQWKDSVIIIMPSLYKYDIIEEFKSLGIPDEQIFAVELE